MDYLTWVNSVLVAAVTLAEADPQRGLVGVTWHAIASELSLEGGEGSQHALHTAGQDLAALGLVGNEHWAMKVSTRGIKVARAGGLRSQWPGIFDRIRPLPEDLEILRQVIAMSEAQGENSADLKLVELKEALQAIGSDSSQVFAVALAQRLESDGCIHEPLLTTAWCQVRPSYLGMVVATQRESTEQEALVRQLVQDWETTSVDFKEVLALGSDRQKAELCKDVLALANTRVSGRRFLVIGFSNRTRRFTTRIDSDVDDHRIESILSAYCEPVPEIRYRVVELAEGSAGLIEVVSDPARLPYRLSKDIGALKAGTVFVRHNTLTAVCEGEELEHLIEEGRRARAELH